MIATLDRVQSRHRRPPSIVSPYRPKLPQPRAEGSGPLASPVPGMLELSAAMRAVAAEGELWAAVAALQREARSLSRSQEATVVLYDWTRATTLTLDGSVMSDEVCALVERVAGGGQREVYGHALVEPIGGAPAPGVLALRRSAGQLFGDDDIALVSALIGGVVPTLRRLLGR